MAAHPISSTMHMGSHQYASLYAHNSNVIQGNVYIDSQAESQAQKADTIVQYGLCLTSAPVISPEYFVGRDAELAQMKHILQPGETATEQRRLVLGGMGGIGKTQLAIAYARRHYASYASVFWLNATTDLSLRGSFGMIAQGLLKAEELENLETKQLVLRVHQWLANRRNTLWLLIFDNYDDQNQFKIDEYIPHAAHGSVIITSRLPAQVTGQQLRVQPIRDLKDGLAILQSRSERSGAADGR